MIRAFGGPLGTARLRACPEDFRVDEILPFRPSGGGEHCLLQIRKRGWTTEAVARLLASQAGVARGAVSFAGLKDRHAVTTQWFSVHAPKLCPALAPGCLDDGLEVVSATRNARKLRRGALSGNRFSLLMRNVSAPRRAVERRLLAIARCGVPNYFGPQRFGRGGRNLQQARAWLLDGEPVRGRTVRGLLISAVRSDLFNRVLARRVAAGSWDVVRPGERAALDGTGSHFPVEVLDAALRRRVVQGDVHPTGPLPGVEGDGPRGEVATLESEVLSEEPELLGALAQRGVRADRRPLRLMPRRLAWHWPAPDTLSLEFTLTAGAYATTVVAEILDTAEE
ncbi:tRNA pseudouridine(13) synthase TruD [Halorhodospira sp. 9621]|uniref:tRNA pseudouridine(13) synthase TruD n=1 Tax=Halorhodospira sp. 9621 TaxID=2899135 RepID=UPI002379E0DC|nr:tRNA pseudouridine(13) synthase TruD [Halorhodospira sp. 9621]